MINHDTTIADSDFLYLTDSEESILNSARYRLSTWDTGYRWETYTQPGGIWEPCTTVCPDIIINRCGVEIEKIACFSKVIDSVPKAILKAIAGFNHKRHTLLHLLAREPRSLDLIDAPSLVLLWLGRAGSKRLSLDRAAALALLPRHVILGAVGGIAEKWAVRVVSRIFFKEYDYMNFRVLRDVAKNPQQLKALRDIPCRQISGEHFISFLNNHPAYASSRIFIEHLKRKPLDIICHLKYGRIEFQLKHFLDFKDVSVEELLPYNSLNMFEDALRLADMLDIADAGDLLKTIPTDATIKRLHDRWNGNYQEREISPEMLKNRFGTTEFPLPPIPGSADIQPITSMEEIRKEGIEMNHCVYTLHAESVMRGQYYVYRMLKPQRATIGISSSYSNNVIELSEMKLYNNAEPSLRSKRKANVWFNSFIKNRSPSNGNEK